MRTPCRTSAPRAQRVICFPLDEQFLAELDAARGGTTRSQFIREAIYRELRSMKIFVDPAKIFPPDRVRIKIIKGSNGSAYDETPVRADRAAEKPKRRKKKNEN